MKYFVTYSTLNDTYTKYFRDWMSATDFCGMIKRFYPDQNPTVEKL